MGRSSPFLVTRIVLRGHSNLGERLPILLDRQSRKPVTAVMEWALSVRRNKPVSANTLERELRHLGYFEAWLKLNGLSLRDPLAFVDAFTPNLIEASLRPWLGKDVSDQKVKKISINPSGIRDRIQVIAAYVAWVLQNAERSLSVRTQAAQILALRAARESVARSLSDILPTQNEGRKTDGLSSSDVTRLLAIIDPQNPHNPWARGNSDEANAIRKRNQVIVLLMLAFGPRRGSLAPERVVHRNAGAPDRITAHVQLCHAPDFLGVRRRHGQHAGQHRGRKVGLSQMASDAKRKHGS